MKYAVVTGGTSGIGLGVAKMLVNKGYYVFATYVGPDFTEKIENFEAIKTDQTNREEVYRFINYVKSKTDHLDCLLLHRPDALMEPDEIGEAFNSLKASGKVLNFGVSNMNPMQMKLLQSGLDCELVANQVQMSVCHTSMVDAGFNVNMDNDPAIMRDGGILEYCRLNHMVVQAWSVLQYGFFKGVFVGSPLYLKLNSVLDRIASSRNVTASAVAIAWVLRYPGLMQAVIGTTKQNRVIECSKACDVHLTHKEWYEIYLAAGNSLP